MSSKDLTVGGQEMIDSLIYLFNSRSRKNWTKRKKTGSLLHIDSRAEMGDSLGLGPDFYESPRIAGFPVYYLRQVLLPLIITPYLVPRVVEQKGLRTGHTNHPALNHFSSNVPKSNSDCFPICITPQTIKWCHNQAENAIPGRSNRKKETTRERKCLLECKWSLCACASALLKTKSVRR